jgi:uncharacterized protein YbbK (DUF523 family)
MMEKEGPILVSACLAGVRCRYHGGSSCSEKIRALVEEGKAIPVCPEELGGLCTPRPKAEIEVGDGTDVLAGRAKVLDEHGRDITAQFLRGAEAALEAALRSEARKAILKERSPSCGSAWIYREGKLIPGMGVTAALLSQYGIGVERAEGD